MWGLTKAAPRIGWLPLLHSSKVSLKAGPRPLTVAFRLKDADDATEVDVAPCNRSDVQSHTAASRWKGLEGKGQQETVTLLQGTDGRHLKGRTGKMSKLERKLKGEGFGRRGREVRARDRASAQKESTGKADQERETGETEERAERQYEKPAWQPHAERLKWRLGQWQPSRVCLEQAPDVKEEETFIPRNQQDFVIRLPITSIFLL